MSMNFAPDEFHTYRLRDGDVLLNEGQSKELVGRPAIYHDELPGVCFTNTLVRFRATEAVLPEFALLVFLYYMKARMFERISKITTNIAHLGAARFAEMSFPIPSIQEQQEIIDRVAEHISNNRYLVEELRKQRQQVTAFRQSVLKSAFSGRLVRQDWNDEPASMLLERIAAERNGNSAKKAAPKRRKREMVTA
jgi:type I restriction enzyme S subunit